MAWFSKEVKSLYIARPVEAAKELIYRHPDQSIPRGANLTVRSDECVIFFREGRFIGRLDAGAHNLDTANIPFLGHLLVDKLTAANHFIAELFFVALSECIIAMPSTELGQYQDQNSRNVVAIQGKGAITVRVKDPLRLITEVGGQSQQSSTTIIEILIGRLANGVRKSVGRRSALVPILSIVSNADAEAISNELLAFAQTEFESIGISFQRILSLEFKLDEESLKLVRDFGKQESGIALQSKGAQVASQAGFAEYNLVQGQRAALEGMGRGFSAGKTTMFVGGGNLGADLTRSPLNQARGGAVMPQMSSGNAAAIVPPRQYFVIAEGRESGPYSPRQVALLAVSGRKQPSEILIRAEGDPENCSVTADLEPSIIAEYRRRMPNVSSPTLGVQTSTEAPASVQLRTSMGFNLALDFALKASPDKKTISTEQIQQLVQLLMAEGHAEQVAKQYVENRLRELGGV